jgi:uncharacterized protein YbaP (TraB family)
MIWKIYKEDTHIVHYILGTMHLSTIEAFTYVDLAHKYSDMCDIYMAEMDLSTVSYEELLKSFYLPEGVTLSSLMKPHHYDRAVRIFNKAFHTDLNSLSHYTPFFIVNSITEKFLDTRFEKPLDHYLWDMALNRDKIMMGLETFEDQKDIMSRISLDFQVKSLKKCIRHPSLFKKKIRHLNNLYAQGHFGQLYKTTKKSMGSLRSLMIYDRNALMLSRLLPHLTTHSVFVAVGAAHLPGKYGLLKGLKNHGYKVKLLKN